MDKHGGWVYGMQLNKVKGLANLRRSGLCGVQSSGCKHLEGESFGGTFSAHAINIHTWIPKEHFHISLSMAWRRLCLFTMSLRLWRP